MTCVTGAAIEPVPLTELELTGSEPPELAGGHTEFAVCHFSSSSGTYPELPRQHKLLLLDGRGVPEQVDICLTRAPLCMRGDEWKASQHTDGKLIKV